MQQATPAPPAVRHFKKTLIIRKTFNDGQDVFSRILALSEHRNGGKRYKETLRIRSLTS